MHHMFILEGTTLYKEVLAHLQEAVHPKHMNCGLPKTGCSCMTAPADQLALMQLTKHAIVVFLCSL